MTLSLASLFAGLGGFDLAAERLGMTVALQAEIDPAAQAVLQHHWPGVRLEADATTVDLRGIDIVTAGFPCQGLSIAAATRKHEGLFDPESMSHVVWRLLDRIAEAKPKYVLLENADSLGSARYAADLRALLGMLEAHGYHPTVVRLNAGCYGANMRRVRTFVLCRRTYGLDLDVSGELSWRCDAQAVGVNNQQGGAVFCAQPSVTKKAASFTLMVTRDEVLSLLPEAVEVLFGLTPGWTLPAGSNAQRYQRLGNAVSVDAAEAALSLLVHGRAAMRAPTSSYASLYPLTRPAGGGMAASALGRIVRSLTLGRGNHSLVEMDHCVPVYLRWIHDHPDTVTEKMRGYLRDFGELPQRAPKSWPTSTTVRMTQ